MLDEHLESFVKQCNAISEPLVASRDVGFGCTWPPFQQSQRNDSALTHLEQAEWLDCSRSHQCLHDGKWNSNISGIKFHIPKGSHPHLVANTGVDEWIRFLCLPVHDPVACGLPMPCCSVQSLSQSKEAKLAFVNQ